MTKRHQRAVLLVACAAAAMSACARGPTKAERIEELMARYHALGLHQGAVLVAQDGRVVYEGGFGQADAAWEIPNGPTVKYRISSTTKMLTGILVLQQVEAGAIDLDAPAASYLPDLEGPPDGRITVDHLLTHRSGLVDYANDLSEAEYAAGFLHRRVPADSVVARMLDRPLEFVPGTSWDYSNTGYIVLQLILERVTGRPYCDLLEERVLEPAGMTDTGCLFFEPVMPRMATGYVRADDGTLVRAPFDHSIHADGMAYSTVRDLFALDQALRAGQVLSPSMQTVMNAPRAVEGWIGDDFGPGLTHYTGYGLESIHRRPGPVDGDSVTVVGHGGGTAGWSSMFWRVPDEGIVIAVLNNVGVPPLPIEIFDILFERPYALPTVPELDPAP